VPLSHVSIAVTFPLVTPVVLYITVANGLIVVPVYISDSTDDHPTFLADAVKVYVVFGVNQKIVIMFDIPVLTIDPGLAVILYSSICLIHQLRLNVAHVSPIDKRLGAFSLSGNIVVVVSYCIVISSIYHTFR
jgi:hypothetical protein